MRSEPASGDQIAQRPSRLRRVRLVPLVLLVVLVAAAAFVGYTQSTPPKGPVAAPVGARALPAACASAPDPVRDDPWRGARRAKSEATYTAKLAHEQPAYVVGRNGWLYFNDYQAENFSQAVGRTRLGVKAMARWAGYIAHLQSAAAAVGSRFVFVIAPAKWDVYPDLLPSWAQRLRGDTSMSRLLRCYPKLPIVDLRSPLRTAPERTYQPLNSHWTPYGGYVAWLGIARYLRMSTPEYRLPIPNLLRVIKQQDENEYAPNGIVATALQQTAPVLAGPVPKIEIRKADGSRAPKVAGQLPGYVSGNDLPVRVSTNGPPSSDTLLLIRDSTGSALSPIAARGFAQTDQVAHGIGSETPSGDLAVTIRAEHPSLTIFTMTERYLNYGPPAYPTGR